MVWGDIPTVFVGHALNEINEIWQQISRTGFKNGTKFSVLMGAYALTYTRAKIGELWHMRLLWGAKIMKGVKNCIAFLLHRLAERD